MNVLLRCLAPVAILGLLSPLVSAANENASATGGGDSLAFYDSRIQSLQEEADYYGELIATERTQLIRDIRSMLNIFPLSRFNGDIMMRLAELQYEMETDEFNARLDAYDRQVMAAESAGTQTEAAFPELRYDSTLAVYKRILAEPAHNSVHDAALFYGAICLLREGREEEAVADLKRLTEEFPTSELFAASQIKIGDYYFSRPSLGNGQGYALAAQAYQKIEQDHPLYPEALYKLGWCYFQQDNYADAIATFRHLIVDVKLNFDETSSTRLISNPLLRAEAVDFFAVSLVESGTLQEASQFLDAIGNADYAAKVLLKIAEIYNTNSDYPMANQALNLLQENYPLSTSAPTAMLMTAENYARLGQTELAERSRLDFFDTFGKGSGWYRSNSDPETRAFVDSQAVKILLSSTESLLLKARQNSDKELYLRVARSYNRLIEEYPKAPGTYGAEWNLAVIQDRHLGNLSAAYDTYMRVAETYKDTAHKREALLNAVSAAQRQWESGTAEAPADTGLAGMDTTLSLLEKNIVRAASRFVEYYPGDPEAPRLMLVEATIQFNRRRFAEAIPLYLNVLSLRPAPEERDETLLLLARSNLGLGRFTDAEKWYDSLYNVSQNPEIRAEADDGRVQSSYRYAEGLAQDGDLEQAARAFVKTAKQYRSSSLADVAMFSGAEAYEKKELWEKAAETFIELSRLFPLSKYADGALFNAAADFERLEQYRQAIDAYEELIRRFPESPQVKNALFNIALDYEKLKDFDMVAATNERYARLFPEEDDVPKLLFEAGKYYLKGERYDKALAVFQRYYTRYLGTEQEIEARVYTARAHSAMGNPTLAKEGYQNAISRSDQLKKQGIPITGYFAAEAQYELANLLAEEYRRIRLAGAGKTLQSLEQQKTVLLGEAVEAYSRAIAYGTQNAIKSAYTIGSLYEDFALAYKSRPRPPEASPAKQAVEEKKVLNVSIKTLEKSLPFYRKSLEFISDVPQEKLEKETRVYRDSSEMKIRELPWIICQWNLQSNYALLEAPVPEKLLQRPLSYYIYRTKVLETTLPGFKMSVEMLREYWLTRQRDTTDQRLTQMAYRAYARENHQLGGRYAELAFELLNEPRQPSEPLPEDQAEELAFQLEDMAFETQDIALPLLEASRQRAQEDRLTDIWSRHLVTQLRRIDPQNYPKPKDVEEQEIPSDHRWWAYPEAVPGWDSDPSGNVEQNRFGPVVKAEMSSKPAFPGNMPDPIWDIKGSKEVFFRRVFEVDQPVTTAHLDITAEEDFTLAVNGKEIYRDASDSGDFLQVKSFNIKPLLRKGTNLIAVRARSRKQSRGLLARLSMEVKQHAQPQVAQGTSASFRPDQGEVEPFPPSVIASTSQDAESLEKLSSEFSTREQYVKALYQFNQRARKARLELRRERSKINNDRFQLEITNKKIQSLEAQLEAYRKEGGP